MVALCTVYKSASMNAKRYRLVAAALIGVSATVFADSVRVASESLLISRTAAGSSFAPQLSADGRYVVFTSFAKNLTTNHFSGLALNIFRRDLIAGETVLVSVDATRSTDGNDNSAFYSISRDGRFVAFASRASNLVENDTNSAADIFLWDDLSRTNQLLTTNSAIYDVFGGPYGSATPPDFAPSSPTPLSSNPQISADGHWVVFESRSSNLVSLADGANTTDVFARDTLFNETFLVSVTVEGTAATEVNTSSHSPRLTPDGRFVLFLSSVSNLIAGGTPAGKSNLFLRDLQSSSIKWVTKDLEVALGWNSNAYHIIEHTISENGQAVAFKVDPLWFFSPEIWLFRYGVETESLTLLTTDSNLSSTPQLSRDGRFLAYESGTNVLIWDDVFHTNLVINVDSSNSRPAAGISHTPVLAADGRSIAFLSNAGDLVPGVPGGRFQVFWRDLIGRFTFLVSANTNDGAANANHQLITPVISGDGLTIAFESWANDLIADDLNHGSDVFAFDFVSEPQLVCASITEPIKPSFTGPGEISISRNCASADGHVIAFFGYDSSLSGDDTNLVTDIFVHDLFANTNYTISNGTNSLFDAEISVDGRFVTYTRRIQRNSFNFYDDIFRYDLLTGDNRLVRAGSIDQMPGYEGVHSMSSDGRYVAFSSNATDLDPRDRDVDTDVYLRDFVLDTIQLMSVNVPGDTTSSRFAPDGQHVFFLSQTQLFMAMVGQTNAALLVSHDPQSPTTPLSSVKSFAISGNSQRVIFDTSDLTGRYMYRNDFASNTVSVVCSNCQNGALNGDGRWVVYEFRNPMTTLRSVYLQNIDNGTNQVVSTAEWLNLPSDTSLDSFSPVISGDGRFVVFLSRVRCSPVALTRLYAFDRSTDQMLLLTPSPDGIGLVSGSGAQLQFARDGRTLVFRSFSDLVEGDYNDKRDVFVLRLGAGDSDGDGLDDDWEMAYFEMLARNGSGDFDGDGQTDLEEFRAGTNPTNQSSIFQALMISRVGGATTIFWHANPGRSYRVEFKASLSDPVWSTVVGDVRLSGSTGYIVDDSHASTSHGFYRVVALP
jgi:Tol biopolymer transport system component